MNKESVYTYTGINHHFQMEMHGMKNVPLGEAFVDTIKSAMVGSSQKFLVDEMDMNALKMQEVKKMNPVIPVVLTRETVENMRCPIDWVGKRVGVTGRMELNFCKAIAAAYNQTGRIFFHLIYPQDLENLLSTDITGYDLVVSSLPLLEPRGSISWDLLRRSPLKIRTMGDISIDRVRPYFPSTRMGRINLVELFFNSQIVVDASSDLTGPVFDVSIATFLPSTPPTMEGFTSRSPRKYTCYGMETDIQELCESAYDQKGQPKLLPTYWDVQACETHDECPFYKANRKFPNERGGCNNGYCEMPVGVTQVSPTMYTGEPMCYPDPSNPYGTKCDGQQRDPDLVFSNDREERVAAGFGTVLALPKDYDIIV